MKIIHTADLHLDSPMESNFTAEVASKRRKELLLNFRSMVDFASSHGVRVILIAGDLFDNSHPSPETEKYVADVMSYYSKIDFLCLNGNHGEEYIPFGMTSNFKMFPKSGIGSYRYDNVVFYGSDSNLCYANLNLSPYDINILALHGQVTSSLSDVSGINTKYYQNKNIDYLALGHYHSFKKENLDDRGVWAYSGTPEGRGFDEFGQKGFVLIDTDTKPISSVFVPHSYRTIHSVPVDVTKIFNDVDLQNAVMKSVVGIPAKDIVRVTFRGLSDPTLYKDLKQIKAMLERQFFFVSVTDESNISLRIEDYKNDISLTGEFVRTVSNSGLIPSEKERVINCGMRALLGEEINE